MPRALAILIVSTFALGACRDAGRTSYRRPTSSTDSGVVVDTGVQAVDAGFVDGGSVATDAGAATDSGVVVRDSGVGVRDSGVEVPDAGPPAGATTVYALQDTTHPDFPGMDARVVLWDVVVTAVAGAGSTEGSFWVQEAGGGPYSGVFVFRPGAVPVTGVQVGDRVSLTGTLTEYFDLTEVVLETLDSARPGTSPAPETVDPADLANGSASAEQWEGVFVRVAGVTVLDTMPDDPDDFGEWVVTGGLRIDDQLFALEPRPSVGTSYTAIIGVHHYGFENRKILPRSAADFVQ